MALARSLAPAPSVLLLDEPLGALDRPLRERLVDELSGLFARLDLTVVAVTHDQREAFALADRLVVIDAGRILQTGTPAEVWGEPRTERGGPAARVHQRRSRPCRGRPAADPVGRPGSGPRGRRRRARATGRRAAGPRRSHRGHRGRTVLRRARTRAFGSPSPTRPTSTWRSRTARWRSLPSGPRSASGSPLRPCGRCRADLGAGALAWGWVQAVARRHLRCAGLHSSLRPQMPTTSSVPRRHLTALAVAVLAGLAVCVAPALAQEDPPPDTDHHRRPPRRPSRSRPARPPPPDP